MLLHATLFLPASHDTVFSPTVMRFQKIAWFPNDIFSKTLWQNLWLSFCW